jgi:hypothetical protein
MGWKSTIEITREEALRAIMEVVIQKMPTLSVEELHNILESLGIGDEPGLPYYGHNFDIV